MADASSHEASSSTVNPAADDPESTMEINVKTMDAQVRKVRVQKNAPVSVLKEKVAEATGVPIDQQRLIFRGRVLQDDYILSEYHLEDGFTLHLVARPAAAVWQHSSGTPEENTHDNGNASGGEELLDDISRIVRDLLGSLDLEMSDGDTSTSFSDPVSPAPEGANNAPGGTQPVNPVRPGLWAHRIHAAQLQPVEAIPLDTVIPNSMGALLEYMEHMDQVLRNNGAPAPPSRDSEGQQHPVADDDDLYQRFPSPQVLARVIERTQQLLGGSAAQALSHIAQLLRNHDDIIDASVRREIQTESEHLGMAMQHMGSMLFELGQTMMMLHMGQYPDEAFVYGGPAVYINSTGPNPIMVQPSFQNTPPFGVSNIPVMGGISGAFGTVNPSRSTGFGDPSQNINVHSTGSYAASGPSVATAVSSEEAVNGDMQDAAITRAAIPPRSSEAQNRMLSAIMPVQMSSQVAVPNQSASSQGSQNTMGNGSQQHPASAVSNIVMEGLQSPAMADTVSNIVQDVDEEDIVGPMFGSGGSRGQQGGFDVSTRMMQQVMSAVVSQVVGGARARLLTSANSTGEPRSQQPQHRDTGEGDNSSGGRSSSQIDLQQARQLIEQHAQAAYGEDDDSIGGMIEELVSDPELANGYLELLVEQLRRRIQSESSQSGNQ